MSRRPSGSREARGDTVELLGSLLEPRGGLGLRAQVLLVLSAVFLLVFPILGIAAGEFGRRALERERRRGAEAQGALLAASLGTHPSRARFLRLTRAAIRSEGPIVGAEWLREGLESWSVGRSAGEAVEVAAGRRNRLRLWIQPRDEAAVVSLQRLVSLYAAVTGGASLALLFLALTVLLVRPLEGVTRAAERLARGRLEARAPVRGGREIARLAVAFNHMAEALAAEQHALQGRVEELERLAAELRAARDQVARAARLASVGRLAAGLAHEVGNPLAGIVGMVDLLRGGRVPEAHSSEFLERIGREAQRIHGILRELLDFARPVEQSAEHGSAQPLEAAREALRLVSPQRKARRVRFDLCAEAAEGAGLPDPKHARVPMPADRLHQVFVNLLLNAVDALDGEGHVWIHIRPEAGPEGQAGLLVRVRDDGPGFPREILEEAFEPFVTSKPPGEGTGLGLAVSRHLVERHGGRIEAHNATEGGAEVRLWLPVREGPEEEPPTDQSENASRAARSTST